MKVAVGVTGGVSAYKAGELVRELQQKGLDVQVIMTAHAQEFVRPLTFAALTGQKVITQMFGSEQQEANVESAIEHIAVAQSIDLLVVAPATADFLAKMAHGIADDFLATLYLATRAPVVVAPAMNVNMWEHPATQENLQRLRGRGVHVVEPEEGYLACGMTGPGRLASTSAIVERVAEVLGLRQDLQGETVLITAGPTREAIDPVRYISNRSSGKMGYALAQAAQRRGARTLLISGPTSLRPPDGVELVRVTTAEEMRDSVLDRLVEATVVVGAAAVADYRPQKNAPQKIRKSDQSQPLVLEPTEDILAEIGRRKNRGQVVVGFAAETENLEASARSKLEAKHLDLIVANDVSHAESGMDSDYNTVLILGRNGLERQLPRLPKFEVANEILNEVVKVRSHGKT
ncbi:MAG: bifunctional phosphopantothenoylcysteine decarboxylase/phosphopantothenate--cysteine ligase CoaBC [Acidobacteria bacterium]|nr:bifunctional phosphopantothenoylcysteine decarboxylase/phosphopantothenate--cysteine ligase CoaBC [Acidobacteriota bacterium]